jgi:hypothetical protein
MEPAEQLENRSQLIWESTRENLAARRTSGKTGSASPGRERENKHLGAPDLAGALLEQIRSVVDQKRKVKTKSKMAVKLDGRMKSGRENL